MLLSPSKICHAKHLDQVEADGSFARQIRVTVENVTVENAIELLRKLYVNAKALGEEANTARQRAAQCKTEIQKLRLGRAMEDGEEEKGDGEQSAGAANSGKEKAPGTFCLYTTSTAALLSVVDLMQNMN